MIDFDGSKELTYDFPREFQVRQGGKTYPFYKLANNKIRFMDEVPAAGGLDIVEVVSKQQQAKPLLCHSIADLAFLTKDDVNKIDDTASRLKDQSEQIEQTIKVTQDLLSETQKYEDANKAEIDALKNDTAQGLIGLAQGLSDANAKIDAARNEALVNSSELSAGLSAHETANNPHKINRKMLGLDKVDNTPDKDKPISKAVQEALDLKADKGLIVEIEDKIEKTKKKQEEMINGLASFGAAYSDPLPSISGKKGKYLKTDGKKTYWAEVSGGGGGTSDYTDLENKPQINNVTLAGNKSSSDLGLQDALISGTNIKTINNTSILGNGNIDVDGLPSQTGQSGKFLTTDGTSASWVAVSMPQPVYNNGTLEF